MDARHIKQCVDDRAGGWILGGSGARITIRTREYFCLGDERAHARFFGCLPFSQVESKQLRAAARARLIDPGLAGRKAYE